MKLNTSANSGPVICSFYAIISACNPPGFDFVCVCVCVFIKLHISAQSGPVVLVILWVYECVRAYVYIYQIAHNRAIRPCHLSNYIPLALVLPKGDQYYLFENLGSDATECTHSLNSYYLSPEPLALPSLLPFYSLDILGRRILN